MISDGLSRLSGELRRLLAANVVVSSNLYLNQDGSISARQGKMLADPGVAVYFKLGKHDRVLACDKWLSAAENMAAIAGHIEAIRAQDRYGVGTVDQAFAGYTALPAKDETWRSALGFGRNDVFTAELIDQRFRERTRGAHPDTGGSHEAMAALNAARDAARANLEAQP